MSSLPWKKIHWVNFLFLSGTLLTTLIGVPWYLYTFGLNLFQAGLFFFFFVATGISITLGYHRLFSHLTFQASWPVKLFTLLFGAAAFESSALVWCADHRAHHKHVDEEEDPYAITKGFFHAHIGWLLFRTQPETPLTWVRDLQKDKLAVWQHRYYVPIAIFMGFGLPTLIGFFGGGWAGALGGFLLAGAARTVAVHHSTFCINSLCHWIGSRPYSGKISARDSFLMAIVTFGEGYHNYHHEFQHDYRNGVKPWQFDPTKWAIWCLHKLGLVKNLRTVPEEKIVRAEIEEKRRVLTASLHQCKVPLCETIRASLDSAHASLEQALAQWQTSLQSYREAVAARQSDMNQRVRELRANTEAAAERLREAISEWQRAHENAVQFATVRA
jgi:stearoyl-CoA desaturase (delta-9 desaturase)